MDEGTRLTKELPVRLTDDEVAQRALEGAAALRECERLELALKAEQDRLRPLIKEQSAEARRLARVVGAREETRIVECRIVFDRPKARAVEVRCDTGEPLSTRAMTPAEIEACDAGELEPGEVPAEIAERVEVLEQAADLDRRRAEFNLTAWADGKLTERAIDRLVSEGLCEVDALIAADAKVIAKVAGVSKSKAQELLDALAAEFVVRELPPPPEPIGDAAWAADA